MKKLVITICKETRTIQLSKLVNEKLETPEKIPIPEVLNDNEKEQTIEFSRNLGIAILSKADLLAS